MRCGAGCELAPRGEGFGHADDALAEAVFKREAQIVARGEAGRGELSIVLIQALGIVVGVGHTGGELGRDGVVFGIHIPSATGAVAIGQPSQALTRSLSSSTVSSLIASIISCVDNFAMIMTPFVFSNNQ